MNLIARDERIPPSRGLILTHNHAGRPFETVNLKRWLRYNRLAFKTAKVDVYLRKIGPPLLPELMED